MPLQSQMASQRVIYVLFVLPVDVDGSNAKSKIQKIDFVDVDQIKPACPNTDLSARVTTPKMTIVSQVKYFGR